MFSTIITPRKPSRSLLVLTCALTLALSQFALGGLGDKAYLLEKPRKDAFELVGPSEQAVLFMDSNDHKGALHALSDLQADIERVTGKRAQLTHNAAELSGHAVIAGTIGVSPIIDDLIARGAIDPSAIKGKWDGYHMQVVNKPLPGVERALVIAGADMRGTIYGIYDVSEEIGVSPWYYWADVPVASKPVLYLSKQLRTQAAPKVKYRGIFLNDEAPALSNWVYQNHGNYNHEFYVKVFELLLRLKANFLWPAMWNNAFADDDPQNMILADEYGIVMSTSHHEPMMRADKEWNRYGKGRWEYSTNPDELAKFWEQGARRNKAYESIFTMGMRGQEDKPMSEGENIELLEAIVQDQRNILTKVFDDRPITDVPQVWCLYKEVQSYYEKGMRVPDDVILLWTDDNWGNIRRLPTPEERQRSGGAGVYYHFDYVGGPRSYRWINTYPISKIWEQMNLAYEYQADQIWITNAGDLKPMEYPIEFFLRMAWDPESWPKERLQEFGILWATREFGAEYAAEIETLMTGYTRHNGRRKPELMEPNTYSLLYYNEAARIEAELDQLVASAEQLYAKIPAEKKSAFFQLVLHPVKASTIVTKLNIALGRNRLYAEQGRADTNIYAAKAEALFAADTELKNQYHLINGGKWNHFMNQPHIGYTNWNNPEGDQLPATHHYSPGNYAEMGIAVEGIESGWPAAVSGHWPHTGKFELNFDFFGKSKRSLEIYNRGTKAFDYRITTSEPWIKLSDSTGTVTVSEKIDVSIDWDKVPDGEHSTTLNIKGTGWQGAHIRVNITKPSAKLRKTARGFVEADGYISIEAASFSANKKASGLSWQEIPQHGRTQSAMSVFPIGDKSFSKPSEAPYLEYDVTFVNTGTFELSTHVAPSWPFTPGHGLRYAVAIGDETPQIIDIVEGMNGTDSNWEESVRNGVRVSKSQHQVTTTGRNKIRLYMIDPGVTLQKIIVDTGGLLPSYLGPEESQKL
ncbi:glycosyl hydrolase 115 family protein [Teredinibacter waterburyi]|uniref:glycosyl hydrolase 115 family protein n=1 Tax=Teredinibacter waterburyi TaxID=1500538 RepID=UPI00165F8265|nr:glycosyl hydrolase 115 family protein [Teredinibacter waterburyi]